MRQGGVILDKKKIKNKIGYVDNKFLKGLEHISGGHYVYIRNIDENGKCDVNIITSLERGKENYQIDKLRQVRKGNTYSIPYFDANFTEWSGINNSVISDVDIKNIKNIGSKKIKDKHKYFIDKYLNKKSSYNQ